MKNLNSAALATVVCALGFGLTSVAGAQANDAQAPQLLVHYSPASLTSESGVRHLYHRLVLAAEKVCDAPQVGSFPSPSVVACRKQAVAGAVAQIHNARLVDLSTHYAKVG